MMEELDKRKGALLVVRVRVGSGFTKAVTLPPRCPLLGFLLPPVPLLLTPSSILPLNVHIFSLQPRSLFLPFVLSPFSPW